MNQHGSAGEASLTGPTAASIITLGTTGILSGFIIGWMLYDGTDINRLILQLTFTLGGGIIGAVVGWGVGTVLSRLFSSRAG